MVLLMGINGFWELRSIRDNRILFQMHDDQVPIGEDPEVWVRAVFTVQEFG